MTPNYNRAALAAYQILLDNLVTDTPVIPLPFLKHYPGVRVMSFTRMADEAAIQREDLIPLFGANQDAATFHLVTDISDVKYVVVYNMRLPYEIIRRGVARELGHIVLQHDGAHRPASVRTAEAMCFAHHLLCPRPVIHMLQESSTPITMNVLSAVTGCSDECVEDMRQLPGVRIPRDVNRLVRDLFERGIQEYIRFHAASHKPDTSPVIDLGTYMDLYEE